MTHLDRKNSSLSFTGASWLGLLLFGAAACDDAAQPERTPGGVLQPVHHDVDATDSDDVSHESGTGDSGVAELEPDSPEPPKGEEGDADTGMLEPEVGTTNVFLEPDPTLPNDLSFGGLEIAENGAAPDEITRAHLLGALLPIFSAFQEDAQAAGATFRLVVRWDSSVSTAQAVVREGRIWEVIAEGGLAQAPASRITHVGCHELGHLIGGYPFLVGIVGADGRPRSEAEHAARGTSEAAEGQADYFSTKDCLSRVWGDDDNSAYETVVPPELKVRCDAVYTDVAERQLCYRIVVSSLEKMQATPANFFYSWEECEYYDLWDVQRECEELLEPTATSVPRYVEPKILIGGYPSRICRLETNIRGALCPVKMPRVGEVGGAFVVPGDVDTPWGYGVVSDETRAAAAPYACHGDHPGARPPCWYNEDVPLPGCEATGLEPHESVCEDGAQRDCGTPLNADERGPNVCRRGCDAEGIACVPPPTSG